MLKWAGNSNSDLKSKVLSNLDSWASPTVALSNKNSQIGKHIH